MDAFRLESSRFPLIADEHPEIVKQLQEIAKAFDEELKRNARPVGTVPVQKTSSASGN